MKKLLLPVASLFLAGFGLYQIGMTVLAEQSGSSPESGADSRLKAAYDFLTGKGANYGDVDNDEWTDDWGTYWNLVMESAAWEPDGTATAALVPSGLTFYAGGNDRTLQTGTLFENFLTQGYDDAKCSANNGEASGSCAAGDDESTVEESTWTLVASGGTAASVTDNAVSVSLTSNKVYRDGRTGLYWTDATADTLDNEFVFVNGDDRANPSGNSCNLNSTGTANAFCDNQDPTDAFAEDNDVSAAEFCLNLELDADNADGDDDGTTGVETDWRLPTQKELMQAYINGAANNLPTPNANYWTSTESYSSTTSAWYVYLLTGSTNSASKVNNTNVMCVRR